MSVVHVEKPSRNVCNAPAVLDGRSVERISAFLVSGGTDDEPASLSSNADFAYLGSKVYGQGFLFDDSDRGGLASPTSLMQTLLAADARNAERIFAYLGGEEVNDNPTHANRRWVINFDQLALDEASRWPDLLSIVRERVKPERDKLREDTGPGAHGKKWWWQFQHPRAELYRAIRGLRRMLVISRIGNSFGFTFLPMGVVPNEKLVVFRFDCCSAFAALQARTHEIWARFFGSTLADTLQYTPSLVTETFPFPPNWTTDPNLEAVGQTYYDFRAALMVRNNEGLTKTYNRFHDPDETDADILELRRLHAAMDRAVLDAYGWTDISTDCVFRLDYEEPEDDDAEETGKKRRKKKPWRLRWPEAVHDEVLARLLALNQQRAEEERKMAASNEKPKPVKKAAAPKGKAPAPRAPGALSLFPKKDES